MVGKKKENSEAANSGAKVPVFETGTGRMGRGKFAYHVLREYCVIELRHTFQYIYPVIHLGTPGAEAILQHTAGQG